MLRLARLRSEDGNVLITVMLISVIVGMLAAVLVRTAERADWASASDRNHEGALGVAEAGVHEAIARIETQLKTSFVAGLPQFTGATEQGTYRVSAQRIGNDFVVDALGTASPSRQLERSRRVRVTLRPQELFDDGYALFSSTNLYLKNNNEVYDGDIWANDSLWAESGTIIDGSVTSAQSWVRLENGSDVKGYVWSGGRKCETETTGTPPTCTSGWGINLGSNGHIRKWAKASVSAPNCPTGTEAASYGAVINGTVHEGLTLIPGAAKTGGGTATLTPPGGQCTVAPAAKPAPTFVFNRFNYDPATYVECPSTACPGTTGNGAAAFTSWLTPARKQNLKGTFVITECNGGQIKLSGTYITGDLTIVTNPAPCANGVITGARVDTDGIRDDFAPQGTEFIIVTHYRPPAGTVCTDKDDVYCAIAAKNHFDATCKVASLLYADNGPVAVKNNFGGGGPNQLACGSVIAAGIQMKNNLQLRYDPIFDRVLGFGQTTYEIARWEELPID